MRRNGEKIRCTKSKVWSAAQEKIKDTAEWISRCRAGMEGPERQR